MKRILIALMATTAVASATIATSAQAEDMVVMRKVFTKAQANGNNSGGSSGGATLTYSWVQDGNWVGAGNGCGTFQQTQSVSCQSSEGQIVADNLCTGTKPDSTRTEEDFSQCTFSWQTGNWADSSATCGAITQTRTVSCERSDGQPAADSSCTDTKPSTTRNVADTSQCTYSWDVGAWSGYSSNCSFAAQRTRTVTCLRSDGTTVQDGFCDNQKPIASETNTVLSGCSYSWQSDSTYSTPAGCGSVTTTRNVWCSRDLDNVTVSSSYCDPNTQPAATGTGTSYSTCTYHWEYSPWVTTPSCGTTTRTRTATCVRDIDGDTSNQGGCYGIALEPTSETVLDLSACTYSWQSVPDAVTPACGATTQTNTVSCRRSDGTTVDGSYCDPNTQPAATTATTDYSTCEYDWYESGWSAWSTTCGLATRTRTVTCNRQDGLNGGDGTPSNEALCSGAGTKPLTTETQTVSTGCSSYEWRNPVVNTAMHYENGTFTIKQQWTCWNTTTNAAVSYTNCVNEIGDIRNSGDTASGNTSFRTDTYSSTIVTNRGLAVSGGAASQNTTTPQIASGIYEATGSFSSVVAIGKSACLAATQNLGRLTTGCLVTPIAVDSANSQHMIVIWAIRAGSAFNIQDVLSQVPSFKSSRPAIGTWVDQVGLTDYAIAGNAELSISGASGAKLYGVSSTPWCGTSVTVRQTNGNSPTSFMNAGSVTLSCN